MIVIMMMTREGRREKERGRAGGIEAEVWRRVAIALHLVVLPCESSPRRVPLHQLRKNHTISRRHLLAERKQSFHATS